MGEQSPLNSQSAKMIKAILWMAETLRDQPEKQRHRIIAEAELRFDLTPLECDFLDSHFSDPPA